MKKVFQMCVAVVLLGSLTIQADPFKTWVWDDPTEYENNTAIPAGDLITRTLKCGNTAGGPYPHEILFISQFSPSIEDMAIVVQNQPGDYYCISTVWSLEHMTESGGSNEVNFSVASGQIGFVPKAPTLRLQ